MQVGTKSVSRREFLTNAGAAATAMAAHRLFAQTTRPATSRGSSLNVVMLVADDQRHDTIAALGNVHIKTPHLDSLVRNGFSFTNARCMGSQTEAVCAPSRACLHTGRTLFLVSEDMGSYATLGQTLQQSGYNSAGFGKWHNRPRSFARSFNAGGAILFGGQTRNQYRVPVNDFSPTGDYSTPARITQDKFSSELFTDPAVQYIHQQKSADRPFFCYVAYTSPHTPRTPPEQYRALYNPATMPLPANFLAAHPFDNGDLKNPDEAQAPFPRTPDDTRRQLCEYYGMISAQDAQVGRVIAALKESGQADNTIIIYTGDHGLAIGSHGLFGKQNVYEHSARIPMIISGPSLPRGQSSDALVYGLDLFPTLCETLAITPPKSIHGRSLAAIISGHRKVVRDSAFHAYIHRGPDSSPSTQHAIHDGRWKMIRYFVKDRQRVQLFDLLHDPDEMHDLSTNATAAKELPRLTQLLTLWQTDIGDHTSPTGQG